MFIPVSLQVGDEAVALLPGVNKLSGIDHVKAVRGKILKIKKINKEYSILIGYVDYLQGWPWANNTSQGKRKQVKIFNFRVVKFTFGGVWQMNPDFDLKRIEREEGCKLDPSFINWF